MKSIAKLAEKTAETYIEIDDDPQAIWIKYAPRKYTAKLEREVNAAIKDDRQAGSLVPAVRRLVVDWDLCMVEGDPVVPLNDESALEDVPTEILFMIVQKIGQEQNPDPTPEEQSSTPRST